MQVEITRRISRTYFRLTGWAVVLLSPASLSAGPRTQECIDCHATDKRNPVATAAHGTAELECTTCHIDHQTELGSRQPRPYLKASDKELCNGCHAGVTDKEFVHLPAGLDCSICHASHSNTKSGLRAEGNALCLDCHSTRVKSKFENVDSVVLFNEEVTLPRKVFSGLHLIDLMNNRGHPIANHPVLRAQDLAWPSVSCTTCHDAHGANRSSSLLVTQEETFISLCQSCHK